MNFFKSSKYKLTGSTKSKKSKDTTAPAQFHQLSSAAPEKTTAKKTAPAAPAANDVTVCFKISNATPFPWQLAGKSSLFPEEIGADGSKMIRIGHEKEDSFNAKYAMTKEDQTLHVTFDVTRRDGKWFLKADWSDLGEGSGFQFKPVATALGNEVELPGPDDEGMLVELAYKAE